MRHGHILPPINAPIVTTPDQHMQFIVETGDVGYFYRSLTDLPLEILRVSLRAAWLVTCEELFGWTQLNWVDNNSRGKCQYCRLGLAQKCSIVREAGPPIVLSLTDWTNGAAQLWLALY